jgi:uncharacterized protein (TIGR03086 family)
MVSTESLKGACAWTGDVLAHVTREQLTLPTPCADWQVHDLIDHIVGATQFFADLAEFGSSPEDEEWPAYSEGDFVTSFGQQAQRALSAFEAPGAMERVMALPTGPAPGSQVIQVATGEIFIHGWDLAKAAGHAGPAADELAADLLASDWPSLCADVRNADPPVFAPELRAPDDPTATERLVSFLGRDPNWPR